MGFLFPAVVGFSIPSHCFPLEFLNVFITIPCLFQGQSRIQWAIALSGISHALSFYSYLFSFSQPAKVCLYSFHLQALNCYCLIPFIDHNTYVSLINAWHRRGLATLHSKTKYRTSLCAAVCLDVCGNTAAETYLRFSKWKYQVY